MGHKQKKRERKMERDEAKLYGRYTDESLHSLALDIVGGQVFTDRHIRIPDEEIVGLIFMPLLFLAPENARELTDHPPGLVFEYYREAGPRSVNGYPTFMSMRLLSKTDTERLTRFYNEIRRAIRSTTTEPEIEVTEEKSHAALDDGHLFDGAPVGLRGPVASDESEPQPPGAPEG